MSTFAQTISVQGTVKDATGEPIIGASVVVPGTTNGTMTDTDGNYIIQAPSQGKLTVSFIGYLVQTIDVSGRNRIDIVLVEDNKMLEEVVVVGYGTQRREAVTGSVASMRGDVLREVQTGNVTSALAGRVPGVQIQQTSSKPGADMQIRIRGTRSLTGDNAPLVVLDGIPFGGTIGDINPNDIKNIDILKDASATAIYGSRGAGGVIIVTTHKGNAGVKPKVTYDAYYGIKTLYHRYPMMTGSELYQLRKDAGMYKDTEGNPTMGLDEAQGNNTDWQDLMFQNAITTNHNISITGGSESGSFNVGTGYYKDQALLPEQNYSRINLRAAIDQNIGKYLRFGLTTNNNYNITNGQSIGLYNTLALSPLIDPWNEDGSWKTVVTSVADKYWAYSRNAIENLNDRYADNQRGFGSYNSLYGEVKIPGVDGLSYRLTLGLDYRNVQRGRYQGMGVFSDTPTAASTASLDKSTYYKWAIEHLITYEKTFQKHHLTLNGLYASEQSHYDRSYANATNVPEQFQYWNIGRAENVVYNPNEQDYWERGLISYMARVMYDYDSRYMFLASVRWDGSSVLAPGHKWITYPGFSAGWNIARESFMESTNNWLDNLKLRVGWGLTSNQEINPYTTLGSLVSRPYNFGNSMQTGFNVATTPNPELGWEFTKVWNFGLDFSFLQNRLSGTIEYYNADTYDILQSVYLPSAAGVGSYLANIGEMNNRGIELSLNGVILENKNGWTWEAGINFYTNRNRITKLASGEKREEQNKWFVDHSINSIFDYEKIGIWQEGDKYMNILEPAGKVGMVKVKYTGEYNADGTPVRQIGVEDRQVINTDPDWQGGFSTRIAYKNWDLNVLGTFQHGGILVSSLHASNGYLNMLTGRRGNVKVDYWTPENTDAKYPKPYATGTGDNPQYGSTLGYFDGSYFKVGSVTLGYNFDSKATWFKRLGLNSARLYFTLQNAFVLFSDFNKETGLDPVTNSYGNENAAVTDNSSLPYRASSTLTVGTNSPQSRNFMFGLNVSF
ncbi:SusC/RagA family TonB-linked outer membrane protein [Bacteroidia bacterium]|nr:SusC/RagA family TonB-linked outer membrane protein [Bacteroidia bacterium]GHV40097.1 SusC/RagA family TonB-linked outer membrane protein [Bacteroidia bacterium]